MRGPPEHDVQGVVKVPLASRATSARKAVTSVPLAALVAPDGTTSAYVSTHTDKEQDVVYLAFASAMEPERQTCVATLVIAAQVWPRRSGSAPPTHARMRGTQRQTVRQRRNEDSALREAAC